LELYKINFICHISFVLWCFMLNMRNMLTEMATAKVFNDLLLATDRARCRHSACST